MATSTITYTDKEDLYIDPSIDAINKVVANDMNQIKNVVNNNATETDKKVNIAGIDITGQTISIIALVKNLGATNVDYARYICKTNSGSSGITDIPVSNTSFSLEAISKRNASTTDFTYIVKFYPSGSTMPYITSVSYNSSSITWKQTPGVVNTKTTSTADTYTCTYINNLIGTLFPIGKIEIFYDNNDHSNYLGFTWQRVGAGRTLVGIDTNDSDFNTIGKTGGEKTHLLKISEMPSHHHGVYYADTGGQGNVARPTASGTTTATSNTGGDQPHNNLQPYIVVAFWRRTA